MAKIYSLPEEFESKIPEFDYTEPTKVIEEKEKKFVDELKDWAIKRNPTQENVGEIIQFPVADGYAMYMVVGTKPVELLHLPLGDAWEFQYVERMTKKDIEEKIRSRRALEALFSKKKEEKGV